MKKFFFVCLFAITCVFFAGNAAESDEIKAQSAKLLDISRDLREKQRERESLLLQERTARTELRGITTELSRVDADIKRVSADITRTSQRLRTATAKRKQIEQEKESHAQILHDGVLAYHRKLAGVPYEENPLKYKVMQEYLIYSRARYLETLRQNEIAEAEVRRLEAQNQDLTQRRQTRRDESRQSRQLRDEKNRAIRENARRIAQSEREIKELQETANEMRALIARLTEAARRQRNQARPQADVRKNSLPWPVQGTITTRFGRSRHATLDTFVVSNGIRIKAEDGAQVRAVEAGVVVFVGQFRSYGRMVIVDHGNAFFSVYGQLASISVREDQNITQGTVVGRLGRGEASVLYFEIRENNTPENPTLWLEPRG